LAQLPGLEGMSLSANWISDISALAGLNNLNGSSFHGDAALKLDHNFLDLSPGSAADVIALLLNRGLEVVTVPQNPLPPGLSSIGAKYFLLGQNIAESPFTAGDPARAGQIQSITAASSNPAVIPVGN